MNENGVIVMTLDDIKAMNEENQIEDNSRRQSLTSVQSDGAETEEEVDEDDEAVNTFGEGHDTAASEAKRISIR
jgi:hypothetical protein